MLDFPRWKIISVILICILSLILCVPNFLSDETIEKLENYLPANTVNLGLDLRGGSHLLIEVDVEEYKKEQLVMLNDEVRKLLRNDKIGYYGLKSNDEFVEVFIRIDGQFDKAKRILTKNITDAEITSAGKQKLKINFTSDYLEEMRKRVIDQSIEIVRRRVDETGTKEPIIQKQGSKYILLQVPGLDDPGQLKDLLGKTAKLTFHMVDSNIDPEAALRGQLDPSTKLVYYEKPEYGERFLVLKKKAILTGDMLVDAQTSYIEGLPAVSFKFNNYGARIFGDVTKKNTGKLFAIVLDNKVISAPVINEPILSGAGYISGGFTVAAANELSLLLRAGALPAPLKIVEERTVGPSLGSDSIESGKFAGMVAVILVVTFMLATYLRFGTFATVALFFNMVFLLAAMSVLEATLTLPGIAGVILTLGMAVDANVLIFERIREETRLGLSPFAAVDHGFRHAFRTIADSNITTLIVAFILFNYGSGPIKGFAVTLTIGILASMFSAITLTRMIIIIWLKANKPKILRI